MQPMLATANDDGASPPSGEAWMHEVKWDGMRVVAEVADGRLRLSSRNGNAVSAAYPELVVGDHLPADAVLDGEVVALDGGLPSFATLATRIHVRNERRARELSERHPVTFMAFDVLRLYGVDLLTMRQEERRGVLERLELGGEGDASHWRSPPAYDDGAALWAATKAQGLEGVVSKRRTALYKPGRRSKDWIKTAHRRVESYAVVGLEPADRDDRHPRLGLGRAAGPRRRLGRRRTRRQRHRRPGGRDPEPAAEAARRREPPVRRPPARPGRAAGALGRAPRGHRRAAHGPPARRPHPPAGVPRRPHRPVGRGPPAVSRR